MNKILVLCLLCLTAMPAMALNDACTKPTEFTVDKRCYVTDAQKKKLPFSATVALSEQKRPYCTGTIVKGYKEDKDTIYVYTAKHCVVGNRGVIPAESISVQLQNGKKFSASLATAGAYNGEKDINQDGDYALYRIDDADAKVPYTKLSDKWRWGGTRPIGARVVGYGSLKIMSDKDINKFKNAYISFLKAEGQKNDVGMRNGGVKLTSIYGQKFMDYLRNNKGQYYADLFNNNKLKVSECNYFSTGSTYKCQVWGGNSGGGIFDDEGNLMGIATRGSRVIGGKNHAASEGFEGLNSTSRKQSSIPIAFQ